MNLQASDLPKWLQRRPYLKVNFALQKCPGTINKKNPLTVCGSSDQLVISDDQKIFEDIGNRKQERGIDEGRRYKQNLRYNHAYGG